MLYHKYWLNYSSTDPMFASSRNVDIVTVTRLVTPLKSRDKVASSSQGIGANYSIVTFQ